MRKVLWTGLYVALGALPTDREPDSPTASPPPPRRERPDAGKSPNALIVLAGAFALGSALAKLIDWRSHAHPRV